MERVPELGCREEQADCRAMSESAFVWTRERLQVGNKERQTHEKLRGRPEKCNPAAGRNGKENRTCRRGPTLRNGPSRYIEALDITIIKSCILNYASLTTTKAEEGCQSRLVKVNWMFPTIFQEHYNRLAALALSNLVCSGLVM